MTKNQAIARYMRTVSAAAAELARALDEPTRDEMSLESITPPLGPVQRRILRLGRIASPEGMRPEEIAKEANARGGPSTHQVLETLERRGLLERLSNGSSPRYRLTFPHRPPSEPVARKVVREESGARESGPALNGSRQAAGRGPATAPSSRR